MLQETLERMDLRKEICEAHCRYYKPERVQEETCRGYAVLEGHPRLWEHFPLEPSGYRPSGMDSATEQVLSRLICGTCLFRRNDCDFVQHLQGAVPCGGFLVLGLLLESGSLTIDNIREIV